MAVYTRPGLRQYSLARSQQILCINTKHPPPQGITNSRTSSPSQTPFPKQPAYSYTRIMLLEAAALDPLVPIRARSIHATLVLHRILDHALALKNLKSKTH
jgi:hypothetical protein